MQSYDPNYSRRECLAGYIPIHSHRGHLSYIPDDIYQIVHLRDVQFPSIFTSRLDRQQVICIVRVSGCDENDFLCLAPSASKERVRRIVLVLVEKLATIKGKRILRSFIPHSTSKDVESEVITPESTRSSSPSLRRALSWRTAPGTESITGKRRGQARGRSQEPARDAQARTMRLLTRAAQPANAAIAAPSPILIEEDVLRTSPVADHFPNTSQRIPDEKPLAVSNGLSVAIALAEPCLFLQGFDQHELATRSSTAMLRGSLHLKIQKPSKLKTISLKFTGRAVTKWPEGIPPKKVDNEETSVFMTHTWPFFNATFPVAEYSTGADHVELQHRPESAVAKRMSIDMTGFLRMNSSNPSLVKNEKRLSLATEQPRSFDKNDTQTGTVAAKGFKTFMPGDYMYNFELPLDSHLPETINVDLGNVKYELEATVERPGAFNKNVIGTKEVLVVRTPSESSLEQVEPIAISRNWDNQLHYDIVISGKSFPLGSQIPIAFKLTPLAKVQCHRIKVYITESAEYFCNNKRVHRTEPPRKMLLFEKRSDGPAISTFPGGSMRVTSGGGIPYDLRAAAARGEVQSGSDRQNLLGNLETSDAAVGPTEMEVNVQLPTCQALAKADNKHRLHFDTTYSNIQVHHWIKIVLRISRPDTEDPNKRRHFEISIDSPFHILSCRATQANTSLPAYSSPNVNGACSSMQSCGCPNAPSLPAHVSSFSQSEAQPRISSELPPAPVLQPPPAAHVHGDNTVPATNGTSSSSLATNGHLQLMPRPMHIIRAPSYNPPAFEDEQPPPPLMTPPPQYNDIASPTTGLADYFARLSDAHATDDAAAAAQRNVMLDNGIASEATVAVAGESDEGSEGSEGMATPTQRRSLVVEPAVAAAIIANGATTT